ncbi:uncharacterized protein BKA78DRAFT_146286 [Phyllosticta capitalensis]|uniref:uncharacterized protein n=1 Tax=Phyllosticta capitalensis TaxID=121624 RepID=UPI003130E2C9
MKKGGSSGGDRRLEDPWIWTGDRGVTTTLNTTSAVLISRARRSRCNLLLSLDSILRVFCSHCLCFYKRENIKCAQNLEKPALSGATTDYTLVALLTAYDYLAKIIASSGKPKPPFCRRRCRSCEQGTRIDVDTNLNPFISLPLFACSMIALG